MLPPSTRKQFCQISSADEEETFTIRRLSAKSSVFYLSILSCISIYRTNIQMAPQVIQPILSQNLSLVTISRKFLNKYRSLVSTTKCGVFYNIVMTLNGKSARQTQQVGDSEVTCM